MADCMLRTDRIGPKQVIRRGAWATVVVLAVCWALPASAARTGAESRERIDVNRRFPGSVPHHGYRALMGSGNTNERSLVRVAAFTLQRLAELGGRHYKKLVSGSRLPRLLVQGDELLTDGVFRSGATIRKADYVDAHLVTSIGKWESQVNRLLERQKSPYRVVIASRLQRGGEEYAFSVTTYEHKKSLIASLPHRRDSVFFPLIRMSPSMIPMSSSIEYGVEPLRSNAACRAIAEVILAGHLKKQGNKTLALVGERKGVGTWRRMFEQYRDGIPLHHLGLGPDVTREQADALVEDVNRALKGFTRGKWFPFNTRACKSASQLGVEIKDDKLIAR